MQVVVSAFSHISPSELVVRFVLERDEARECQLATEIRKRADAEVLHAIGPFVRQGAAFERRRGVDLLSILGSSSQQASTAARLLLEVLQNEIDPDVLQSVCLAFGRLELPDDSRLLSALTDGLVRLEAHPDARIREALVIAFGTHPTPHVLDVLCRMSADDDEGVRNWATFGIARLTDADSHAIRSALTARLNDDASEIRAEALYGLAKRVAPGVEDCLIDELHQSEVHALVFDAIEQIGHPSRRLLRTLQTFLMQTEANGTNTGWRKRLQDCIDAVDRRRHEANG